MNTKIKSALIFIRFVDEHDGNISLTNVCVIVGMATGNPFLVVAAIAAHTYKKYLNKDKSTTGIEELKTKLDVLNSQVTSIAIQSGFKAK